MPQQRNTFLSRHLPGQLQTATGHLVIAEERVAGQNAGDFSAGAWRQRNLNTIRVNTILASMISPPILVLPRGVYEVRGSAPAHQVNTHKLRLQSLTHGVTLLMGTSEYAYQGIPVTTRSVLTGRIWLVEDTEMTLQHRCGTTRASDGMGRSTGWQTEVYAVLELVRVR